MVAQGRTEKQTTTLELRDLEQANLGRFIVKVGHKLNPSPNVSLCALRVA